MKETLRAFRAPRGYRDGTFLAIFCTCTILDLCGFQHSNSHGLVADFDSNIGILVANHQPITMMPKYLLAAFAMLAATIVAAETVQLALDANGNNAKILIPRDALILEE